jgi:hypothetical protein
MQGERRSPVKYFMDTHDRATGTFPAEALTDALGAAGDDLGVFAHAAHVNLRQGKTFCFMSGPDEDAIRKAHAVVDFPFDSITEVRRVTGADMRPEEAARATRSGGVGDSHAGDNR